MNHPRAQAHVLLTIRYDDKVYVPPATWDWVSLLDLPDADAVTVEWASALHDEPGVGATDD